MRRSIPSHLRLLSLSLAVLVSASLFSPWHAQAQTVTPDTPTPTVEPSATATTPAPPPTTPPSPTAGPSTVPAVRPIIVVVSYTSGEGNIVPGQPYDLAIRLENAGSSFATNIIAVFTPGDFVPRKTGGVIAVEELAPGETQKIIQPVTASASLLGKNFATLVMQVSYTDLNGVVYTESFNLALPVVPPRPGAFNTATPTPTLTPVPPSRPQLVISHYSTDLDTLQPGTRFNLEFDVQNEGNATARQVSMIIGGGSSSGGAPQGTLQVGGVSAGGADLGNFAPVASSNVQFLGDLPQGQSLNVQAMLIVNATTNPGAYPLKISFTYADDKGTYYSDDQVVTLLVYSLPQLEVNYYRPPDPLFVGQPGILPLQVVNIGRKSAVLGTMHVSSELAELSNNEVLVGPLDPGGYYTLDTSVIPQQSGMMQLNITIAYLDDFSQPRMITDTLTIEVQEAPASPPPGEGGMEGGEVPLPERPQSFWQKIWRIVLGLLGLNSGAPTPQPIGPPPGELPTEMPVPVPNTKG